MNLFLLYEEDDPEGNFALVEKEEDAKYLLSAFGTDDIVIKHNIVDHKSPDDTYYFLVDNDEYAFIDDCFVSFDESKKYAMDNLSNYQIYAYKINTLNATESDLDDADDFTTKLINMPETKNRGIGYFVGAGVERTNNASYEYAEHNGHKFVHRYSFW